MVFDRVHGFAAATSAALLTIQAMAPLDAASAQTPRNTVGSSRTTGSRQAAASTAAIIAPTSSPELLFVPIQPCRAFNTNSSTGPITAGTTRDFYVSGTAGFPAQGGTNGGCGLPASATAVAISLTAFNVSGSASGKMIAYPYGNAVPSTASVSFSPGVNQTASVIVGVNQAMISLQAKNSSAQVSGDITGYFVPQMQAYVQADGTVYSGTTRIISSSRPATGQYQIVVDRDVYTCATSVSPATTGFFIATGYGDKNNTIDIFIYGFSNGAFSPVNVDFNMVESC